MLLNFVSAVESVKCMLKTYLESKRVLKEYPIRTGRMPLSLNGMMLTLIHLKVTTVDSFNIC